MGSEVLFIGGRSGVGKTSAALAMHELLKQRDVKHALIEGDNLDLAHPPPHLAFPHAELALQNLRFMWQHYRELGYRRLIYTNTASVLEAHDLAAAMADEPAVTAVLLRATDSMTSTRLHERTHGALLESDLAHSIRTARRLDRDVPREVHRIDTDTLSPRRLAERLIHLVGW